MSHSVAAVVIAFNPDGAQLRQLIEVLLPQVDYIVVVDNASNVDPSGCWADLATDKIRFVRNSANLGIATAQNIGIKRSEELGAEYVLLMDQDSIPAGDMVSKLLAVIQNQSTPACAGPRYVDDRQNNPPPFLQIKGLRLKRWWTSELPVVPVDYLIASGCLIPMAVLQQVGGMREDLFIDYVDIEWGLRAKCAGYQSYGCFDAHMQHSLGDNPVKFRGRQLPIHSPLRHYYHFRNAVLLYKEPWIPLNWKIVDVWRLLLKYGFYMLYATPRLEHTKMMTLGMVHGLIGKAGKFQES